VYATVASQAEQAAAELDCDVAPGLFALIEREDVRALLLLEADWHAAVPGWMACQLGKPAFLAGSLAPQFCRADLQRRAADAGVTLMPGLAHRYTPATSRLKELIATRLGRPQSIEIVAGLEGQGHVAGAGSRAVARERFAAAVDWCVSLVGTMPVAIVPNHHNGSTGTSRVALQYDIEFRRPSAGGDATRAQIEVYTEPLPPVTPNVSATRPVFPRIRVRCAKGEAVLEPPCGITWDVGGARVAEALTSDRTAVEVMLDHFTRRVLGGLIPVPTLDDVLRARDFAAVLPE
jgi:hypothetical protein